MDAKVGQTTTGPGTIVLIFCFLGAFVDGIDTQMLAIAVPLMAQDWGLALSSFAPAFAGFSAGLIVGSVVAGWSSDKVGLKSTLIASIATVGISTLLVPSAGGIAALAAVRFFSGSGVGGAMVCIVAICTQSSDLQKGERMALIAYIGAPLGYLAASLGAAKLLNAGQWQPLFYIGAGITLVLVVAMAFLLPTVTRSSHASGDRSSEGAPGRLFGGRQTVRTLLLWSIMLIGFTATYLLLNWLPSILTLAGLSAGDAAVSGSVVFIGSIIGTLAIAGAASRYPVGRVLAFTFVLGTLAAVVIQLVGAAGGIVAIAMLVVLGLSVVGGQIALMVLSASLYEPRFRGRGVGWANGMGRVGSLLGPVLGGVLLASPLLKESVFAVLAVLIGICAAGVAGLGMLMVRPNPKVT